MSAPYHRRAPNVSKSRLLFKILDYMSEHDECMISVISETRCLTRRRVKETLEESVQYGLVTCRVRQTSHKAMLFSITDLGRLYLLALKTQSIIAPFDDMSEEDWGPGSIEELASSIDEMRILVEKLMTATESYDRVNYGAIGDRTIKSCSDRIYDKKRTKVPAERNDLPAGNRFI